MRNLHSPPYFRLRVIVLGMVLICAAAHSAAPSCSSPLLNITIFSDSLCPDWAHYARVWEHDHADSFRAAPISFKVLFTGEEHNGEKYGFKTPSGNQQVLGNLFELCIVHMYSELGFSLIDAFKCVSDQARKLPFHLPACSKFTGLDYTQLEACAKGELGKALFKHSIKESDEKGYAGEWSPTVYLNGEKWCAWNHRECKQTKYGVRKALCDAMQKEAEAREDACQRGDIPALPAACIKQDAITHDCDDKKERACIPPLGQEWEDGKVCCEKVKEVCVPHRGCVPAGELVPDLSPILF